MELFERAFRLLPDTVIITDLYWYILDYNHAEAIKVLRKGVNLTRIIRDCKDTAKGKFRYNEIIFQRTTTPVYDKDIHVGYVVYLANITERETLIQQRLQKNAELEALIREQARANAELEDYLHQAEALVGYEEQLRIARSIHDDAGHAITELNTISQMCLQLRETDPEHYRQLISQGIELCKRSMKEEKSDQFKSLREMLEQFRAGCEIPVDLLIAGEEPVFAGRLYSVIGKICKEAYQSTFSLSSYTIFF
jgi:signal transduction histidine kinase